MEEVSQTIYEMQQRTAPKTAKFISTGGEKTSFQPNKYEKPLNNDELYLIIEEEQRTEASKGTFGMNKAKNRLQKKRQKEAEKPLYLMRYE